MNSGMPPPLWKEPPVERRPEPIRKALLPSAVLIGLLIAITTWGAGADWRVATGIAAGQTLVYLGVGHLVRSKVTPTADPRDNDGRPLVPAEDLKDSGDATPRK